MKFSIPPDDKVSFLLTPEQGELIREFIVQQIDVSFRYYVISVVGMHYPNVSSILSGKRRLSISHLRRLLSGTRIEVEECILSFTLENLGGGIVENVDSPTLEEMLSLHEENQLDMDDQEDTSSQSEKPLDGLKTLLGSRSWENPDESYDSSSEE